MTVLTGKIIYSSNAAASEFGNGISIVNVVTGAQYRLEGVAWFIWRELGNSQTVENLIKAVQEAYGILPDVSRQDVQQLLGELVQEGLVAQYEREK